jgi:hypothetical protein
LPAATAAKKQQLQWGSSLLPAVLALPTGLALPTKAQWAYMHAN